MFEKYNIDDLFIAHINVFHIKHDEDLEFLLHTTTILIKDKLGKYINLKNGEIIPFSDYQTIKEIAYIEPLSNYYDQNGKKKIKFSRKQVLEQLKENYEAFNKKCEDLGKTYIFTKK